MSVMEMDKSRFDNSQEGLNPQTETLNKRSRVSEFVGRIADVASIWPKSERVGNSEHERVIGLSGEKEKREHNPLMPVPTFQHEFQTQEHLDFLPGSHGFSD